MLPCSVAMCVDSCGFAIAVRIVMDASKRSFARPGCNIDLSADFLNFGAGDLSFRMPFYKCFKIVCFFALAPRSGFGTKISVAVARSSMVLY